MKLHSEIDLITNSSSSVFIFSLKEEPKDLDHLISLLFPGCTGDENFSYYEDNYTLRELCYPVFYYIKNPRYSGVKKLKLFKDILKTFEEEGFPSKKYIPFKWGIQEIKEINKDYKLKNPNGEINEDLHYSILIDAIYQQIKRKIEIENQENLKKDAIEIWDKMKDQIIYKMIFSDHHSSAEAAIEHVNFFRNVPHVRIS